jgi:hypothetical protein
MNPVSCVSYVSWMYWLYAVETHESFHWNPVCGASEKQWVHSCIAIVSGILRPVGTSYPTGDPPLARS